MTLTQSPAPAGAANADVLRRYYAAVAEGDLAAAAALLDPDVVVHVPGRSVNTGDHVGRDAVMTFLAEASALTEGTLEFRIHDVLGSEEHAVCLTTYTARRPDRAPLANHLAHVVRIEHGRIAESWFHSRNQYEVDAFWGEG